MELIVGLIEKYPVLVSILAGVGIARAIFKPLFSFLAVVAAATPTKKDDELLVNVEKSKVYKAIAWFLDYVASIKLPK